MEPSQTMQAILSANGEYLQGRRVKADVEGNCLIAACISCRLNAYLPVALGLDPDRCYMVRNPGPAVTAHDNSVLRAAAIASASGQIKLIVVLGHGHCSAASDAVDLINRLESGGVPRSRLDSDLRGWFGLIGPIQGNVRSVVDALAGHPSLPGGITVLGMLIDEKTGRLSPVCQNATLAGATASASLGSSILAQHGVPAEPLAVAGPMKAQPPAPAPPVADEDEMDLSGLNVPPAVIAQVADALRAVEPPPVSPPRVPPVRGAATKAPPLPVPPAKAKPVAKPVADRRSSP